MPQDDTEKRLKAAIEMESARFKEYYQWLIDNMPTTFFSEVPPEQMMLVAHSLMGFHLQDFFSQIFLKHLAIVLCLDSPDADVRVLSHYRQYGIKHYRAHVSKSVVPVEGVDAKLRISVIFFTEAVETTAVSFPEKKLGELRCLCEERNPELTDEEFNKLIHGINTRFLASIQQERLILALDMFFRAKDRDHCQYEVRYNDNWEAEGEPSMQVVFAWKNTPKSDFLYRLARLVRRHGLSMKRVNATYIDPYSKNSILIMALGLHGSQGQAAWEAADIPDFLRELVTLKYFGGFPEIVKTFTTSGLVRGNLGNLLKSMLYFIHQVLVHADPWVYTLDRVEEALCRHPELTTKILKAFDLKFHPENRDLAQSEEICKQLLELIEKLDTGHEMNDRVRRNVLRQGVHFVQYTLKSNFYRNNKTAFSFRLDPAYLDAAPFDRKEKFPELPYAIFFIKGLHFIGFQIRFRDLARGGLRTVFPEKREEMLVELNNVFAECYGLAYTQQKKNKDIPEGGAKAIIFLKPNEALKLESDILKKELKLGGFGADIIEQKVQTYVREQRSEYLLQTQRAFVSSLLTIVNCQPDGTLKAKHVVDYYNKPEYLYLGPDERMGSDMIRWIADFAKHYDYRPGISFISSKPKVGINHKEYGVTSLGVNVYMHQTLLALGIDPEKDRFTIKISGGPDGDVAGNQIKNLHHYYKETAKLLALTDVSGTIYDPEGLDLDEMLELFKAQRPISYYPPTLLSEGGFLLDRRTKKDESAYVQLTLCWRKKDGKIVQDWLTGSEMTRLFQTNVHQTKTDIFIPAGGRPRTLHGGNYKEFLDEKGVPTSKAIVEGANLYLTREARRELEILGTWIIRDSSANKCGVIASSYEVLNGLVLSPEEMLTHKDALVEQVLEILRERALDEARLMLDTHKETGAFLTDISEMVSQKINAYTDQLMSYLVGESLPTDPKAPHMQCFLNYLPPFLQTHYRQQAIEETPDVHKKAIIASHIAAKTVYKRGLEWSPSIVDVLPVLWEDHKFHEVSD